MVHKKHINGFTMVELVVTLVILGLLAAYAAPRFFDAQTFSNRGFYNETINAVRYAQQFAVATNCNVQVNLTSSGYALNHPTNNCNTGDYNQAVPHPARVGNDFEGSDSSVGVSPTTTFTFNALGVPSFSSNLAVTVGGISFTIHADTGYIEEN